MYSLVVLQNDIAIEIFATINAVEFLLFLVDLTLVLFQISVPTETFCADIAEEWLILVHFKLVPFQMGVPSETF